MLELELAKRLGQCAVCSTETTVESYPDLDGEGDRELCDFCGQAFVGSWSPDMTPNGIATAIARSLGTLANMIFRRLTRIEKRLKALERQSPE